MEFLTKRRWHSGVYVICAVLIINWTDQKECRAAFYRTRRVNLRALTRTRVSHPADLGIVDLQPLTRANSFVGIISVTPVALSPAEPSVLCCDSVRGGEALSALSAHRPRRVARRHLHPGRHMTAGSWGGTPARWSWEDTAVLITELRCHGEMFHYNILPA